jgi:hypothetical protein
MGLEVLMRPQKSRHRCDDGELMRSDLQVVCALHARFMHRRLPANPIL